MRFSVAFVILGMLVSAVMYDRLVSVPQTETETEGAIVTPSITDPARLEAAWYCPVGSSSAAGYAEHTVIVSNLGEDSAAVSVSTMTGEGRGPSLQLDVAPFTTEKIPLSQVTESPVAGAALAVIGGDAVVSHQVVTTEGTAEGPCATHVSDTWYFASGRTTRDSSEVVALMNPFPEDVVFNMQLHRPAGRPRLPSDLQGAVVPAHSVRLVHVEDYLSREEDVAAVISTVTGRLVAERLQIMTGDLGPQGAALQLGTPNATDSWMLVAGRIHEEGSDRVIVFNPNEEETATVNIDLWPLNATDRSLYGLVSIPRELLPGRFEVIDLNIEASRFGLILPYEVGISVSSTNGVSMVAERWQFASKTNDGLLAGTGIVAPADPNAEGGNAAGAEVAASGEDPEGAEDATSDSENAAAEDGEGSVATDGVGSAEAAEVGDLDIPGIFGGVAQELQQPTADKGIATSRGTERQSNRWIVPWVPTPNSRSSTIVVSSLHTPETEVEVYTIASGALQGPFQATVEAGGRVNVPLPQSSAGTPVLVIANAPISVEAHVVDAGVRQAIIPGIPTISRFGDGTP